jgi:hypothetical protein
MDLKSAQGLYVVRAHLLHYAELLTDFRMTVEFVVQTPNPVLEHASSSSSDTHGHSAEDIAIAKAMMLKESTNLLNQIGQLERRRNMLDQRLTNVTNLVRFAALCCMRIVMAIHSL